MNIAQSLAVALIGSLLAMPLMAEEINEPDNSDDLSGFSVSCGYQGINRPQTINHETILNALNAAAGACEVVGNIDAYDLYSEKAVACTENKANCLISDYKETQKSWCGHKFVHPVDPAERYPVAWAQNMEALIKKAKMACEKSTDPIEVTASQAYFEQLQPDTCTSNHASLSKDVVSLLPELCISMYHDISHNGAPY